MRGNGTALSRLMALMIALGLLAVMPSVSGHGTQGTASPTNVPASMSFGVASTTSTSSLTSRSTSSSTATSFTNWLNAQLVNWRPTSVTPVMWTMTAIPASYDNVYATNFQTIQADLDMLSQLGAGAIRVDMGFDPFLGGNAAQIQLDDQVVSQIRSMGKTFVLADAAAEVYRNYPIPSSQFAQAWVSRVETLAARYHPDYYIVVKEPGWYYPMMSDYPSNPAIYSPQVWQNLTIALASAVLSVSPNTKVGISVSADQLQYTNIQQYVYLASKIPQISFIGIDVYSSPYDYSHASSYLKQYGTNGKSVWIAETWSADGTGVYNQANSQTDAEWAKVIYYYCQSQIHCSSLAPFYTDLFAQYSDVVATNPSFYSTRTPVATAFQQIIAANLANQLI
jgi:hypothetical protein